MIDLTQYFDLTMMTPSVIRFHISAGNNLKASIIIEDRERTLLKRRLKSDVVAYNGIPLELENLTSTILKEYFLTISQRINLEMDSGINCKNYPTKKFKSYSDCDEDYVYNQMRYIYKIMPFWAAKTLDEVTKLM